MHMTSNFRKALTSKCFPPAFSNDKPETYLEFSIWKAFSESSVFGKLFFPVNSRPWASFWNKAAFEHFACANQVPPVVQIVLQPPENGVRKFKLFAAQNFPGLLYTPVEFSYLQFARLHILAFKIFKLAFSPDHQLGSYFFLVFNF